VALSSVAGITWSASTPRPEALASAGTAGAGTAGRAAIGLRTAFGAGLAIAPLIGAAIVAMPSAPAMPTFGALSEMVGRP
jgi:hypothetical protein